MPATITRLLSVVFLLSLIFICLFLPTGSLSFAQTRVIYYIDDNGSDSNPGTLAQPFRTIERALSATPAGNEYVFLDGQYNFTNPWDITRGGTGINDYVVYRSLNRWGATIRLASGGYTVVRLQANYIEFNGFHIDGNNFQAQGHCISSEAPDQGFVPDINQRTGYHHQRILNNWVHHCGSSGIQMNYGDFYFVEGNLIHNNSYISQWMTSGISVYYPTPMTNSLGLFPGYEQYHMVVRNNVSHSNMIGPSVPTHYDGNGLIFDRFRRNYTGGGPGSGYQHQTLIENNLIYNNGGQGIHLYQTDNVTIRNNTLFANQADPFFGGWRAEMSNYSAANNQWYNNIAVAFPDRPGCSSCRSVSVIMNQPDDVDSAGTIWQNNILFTGTPGQLSYNGHGAGLARLQDPANGNQIGVNPLLVSPGLGNVIPGIIGLPNFRPQANSPALGAASATRLSSATDMDGNARINNRDIGAYEVGGTAPTATLPMPVMHTPTPTPFVPTPVILPGAGSILRELWVNIPGMTIAELRAVPTFPNNPDQCDLLNQIFGPSNGDNYGQRLRGYIIPSTTAVYTFWIAGDDEAELWLSSSSSPVNISRIAWIENGYTNRDEWTKYPSQRSNEVSLTAGQRYYFETLHKEGTGGDIVQVAWSTASMSRQIIGSANLSSDGMSCGLAPTNTPTPSPTLTPTTGPSPTAQPVGNVIREIWTGIPGISNNDLRNSPRYPNNPDQCVAANSLSTPYGIGDNYGQRLRGFITPPATGNYVFWLASDNNGEFFLSTNSSPANLVRQAWVDSYTSPNVWNAFPTQQSVPLALTAGQPYYFEILHKDGDFGDFVQVAWEGSGIRQEIIGSQYLSSTGLSCPVPTTLQPTNTPLATATATMTPTATLTSTLTATATATLVPTAGPSATPTTTLPPPATFLPTNTWLALTLSPMLPGGVVGQPYHYIPLTSGGTAPYTYTLIRGSLPAGLSLNPNGAISGTPTQAGMSTFGLLVTDRAGSTTWQEVNLTITPPSIVLVFTPSQLPVANVNAAYQAQLGAFGGTQPYTFTVTAGSLPAGLVFNGAAGIISGTPTIEGSTTLTFQVIDNAGNSGVITYILTVAPQDALAGH
jgi:parallel beta-helix repeat protein